MTPAENIAADFEELADRIRASWRAECGTEEHAQELWFALDRATTFSEKYAVTVDGVPLATGAKR